MKRVLAAVAIICLTLTGTHAQLGEMSLLVKISELDGSDSYRVMSMAEYKALEKQVRDETRYFRKAVDNAKKAWTADESHNKISFPGGALRARKLRMAGRYKNREEAEEKLSVYEDRLAKAEIKAKEKDKERSQRDLKRAKSQQAKEKMTKKIKEAELRDAEKRALCEEAADLIEAELEKLMPAAKKVDE